MKICSAALCFYVRTNGWTDVEKLMAASLCLPVATKPKWILKKSDTRMWSGLIWLRIGTGDGLF
jgi:hypothetical protein